MNLFDNLAFDAVLAMAVLFGLGIIYGLWLGVKADDKIFEESFGKTGRERQLLEMAEFKAKLDAIWNAPKDTV